MTLNRSCLILKYFLILFLICYNGNAQIIRGYAMDSLGLAFPGLLVEGIDSSKTRTYTITDLNGLFKLKRANAELLYIKGLGCKSDTIRINSKMTEIKVMMQCYPVKTPTLFISKDFREYNIDSTLYLSKLKITIPGSENPCYDDCEGYSDYVINYSEPTIGYKSFYLELFKHIKDRFTIENEIVIYFTINRQGLVHIGKVTGLKHNLEEFKRMFYSVSSWTVANISGRMQTSDYSMNIKIF